jgi:hypothetical protein
VPQHSTQYETLAEWSRESTLNGAPLDSTNMMPFDKMQDSYSIAASHA